MIKAPVDIAKRSSFAVRMVDCPGIETVARQMRVLVVDLQHAFDVVADVVVFELAAGDPAAGALSGWTAPVNVADLEQSVILAAVGVQSTDRRRVEV